MGLTARMRIGPEVVIAAAEVRTRWRSLLALALFVGLGAGATVALVGGARRTSTVVDRYRDAHLVADVLVQPDAVDPDRLAALRADPSVAAAAPLAVVFARVEGTTADLVAESHAQVATDGTYGVDLDRPESAGAPLDQDDPEAVEISSSLARSLDLSPGDPLVLETLSDEQIVSTIFEGDPTGAPEGPASPRRRSHAPPRRRPAECREDSILLTRALWDEIGRPLEFEQAPDPSRLAGFANVLPTRSRPGHTADAVTALRRISRRTTSCSWRRPARRRPASRTSCGWHRSPCSSPPSPWASPPPWSAPRRSPGRRRRWRRPPDAPRIGMDRRQRTSRSPSPWSSR